MRLRRGIRTMGLAAVIALGDARALPAQAPVAEPVDRIAAVVGERAVLISELYERLGQLRDQGQQLPDDTTEAFRTLQLQILQQMVDEEVVYQRARRDTSINVTDAELQGAVDQQFRRVRGQFRTEPEFRAALQGSGWSTPDEYRRWLTDQQRREAYFTRYVQTQRQQGKLRSGTVTDAEMRQYYDAAAQGGQLPQTPPTITFRQILLSPRPSEAARQAALLRLDSIRGAIERGADFATVARQVSEDEGSKAAGGDLGSFRRGTMVRQFEEVAFALRPGIVSPPVRTEYGYHLILVDRILPGEIKARHILIKPVITNTEGAAARARADTVATLLRGGANLDSLLRVYGDSGELRQLGPTLRDSLPTGYREALANAQTGQIVGPAPMTPETPLNSRWLVVQVVSSQGAHTASYEEVRDRIRLQLIDQRGMRNMLDDLRKRTYIDIRL